MKVNSKFSVAGELRDFHHYLLYVYSV